MDSDNVRAAAPLARVFNGNILFPESMPAKELRELVQSQARVRRETIRALEDEILQLHTIQNQVAPMNRLPPELLTMIFRHVRLVAPKSNRDMFSISHVCRYWRDVALCSPALWTRLVLKSTRGIGAFVKRSKNLPLQFEVSTTHVPITVIRSQIHAVAHRIRSLEINLPRYDGLTEIYSTLRRIQLPMLEELALLQKPLTEYEVLQQLNPDANLYEPGCGNMPALRSLKLYNLPVPFLPETPTAITHISIEYLVPTVPALMKLLERCPLLEHLSLVGYGPEDGPTFETISLPNLRHFKLTTREEPALQYILSKLILPPHTTISYALTNWTSDGTLARILPSYHLPSHLTLAPFEGLKRLELLWTARTLSMRAFRDADEFLSPTLEFEGPFMQSQVLNGFLWDWPFDTSQVQTLVISGRYPAEDFAIPADKWRRFMTALPALKTLRLMSFHRFALRGFLRELLLSEQGPLPQPFLPLLEVLEIFDADMDEMNGDMLKWYVQRRGQHEDTHFKRLELFNTGSTWTDGIQFMAGERIEVVVDED
ncbi:hypothetical protein BD413DRAFT_301484 [Trametes elegans]|nr:hypothetical protein BD413DRAFT_301484 [Trametes elegans]